MTSKLTCVIELSSLRPVFDSHGQRSNPLVNVNIRLNHTCVFDGGRFVDIHVACYFKRGIPQFDDGNFGMRDADNTLHSICGSVSIVKSARWSLACQHVLLANRSAMVHILVSSSSFELVIQISTSESHVLKRFPDDPKTCTPMSAMGHRSLSNASIFCMNIFRRESLSSVGNNLWYRSSISPESACSSPNASFSLTPSSLINSSPPREYGMRRR